jgi:hypothetical protein
LRDRFSSVISVLFVLVLVFGAGLRSVPALQQEPGQGDSSAKKGDELFEAKKYRDAIDAYKDAVAKDPNNEHALMRAAGAYSNIGDLASARDWMKRAVDVPNQGPSTKSRALTELAVLNWDEADIRLAGGLKPADTAVVGKLVADGIDSAQKALALAPKSAKAFNMLNLLDRTAAAMEQDPEKQKELLSKADDALRQSLQCYEGSAIQQQYSTNDKLVNPMVSGLGADKDSLVKIGDATKKQVPDALKDTKGVPVVIEAFVNRDGKVILLRLVSGPGKLGEAAVEALHHWEFQPSTFEGHPVQTLQLVTFPVK